MTPELALDPAELPLPRQVSAAGTSSQPGRRIVSGTADIDLDAAERAAADFLAALGIDRSRVGLWGDTGQDYASLRSAVRRPAAASDHVPQRRGLRRAGSGAPHLLRHGLRGPSAALSGVAHIGYLPGERILGLSKLARLVEHFAARPQIQERLTKQIDDCLTVRLRPRDAGVLLEAEHTCMTLRGVRARGTKTVTSARAGTLRTDARSRAEFFALAGISPP